MDASGVSVLLYRRSKPVGKLRRRVQDLRIPSSCHDFTASRSTLDLSHNESARLAADSLLSRGLEGYHEMLNAEGEVDFLSEPEKIYFLENGRDGKTADPGASDDGDKEFENSSLAGSTESDPTVIGLDLSCLKDMNRTDPVLDERSVEVYFQTDSRAAGMKDLIREFIRKAGTALAIVMDSFSDVELLCDLLEASRKRNVSVHLLLDHLNLNLFISMWQDLKLNSIGFPKLSVRSVDGQTYCAKTGRKLTGQIAENFIITDWAEVLTGSYSFSWLTWQVHRSLAVLVKGSTVEPFHKEFLRLYSSSKPVPGFVNFITVPHTVPLYTALAAFQNTKIGASESKLSPTKTMCHRAGNEDAQNTRTKAKMPVLSNPHNQALHRAGPGTQEKPPQLNPKPLVQPGALPVVSVDKSKHTVGAQLTQHCAQTHVEPLEKNQAQIQSHANPLSQTPVSNVQSQLTSLTITTTDEKNMRAQESTSVHAAASPTQQQHRVVSYQSTFKSDVEHHVGTEAVFFQQRNRNRLVEPSGIAAGLDKPSRQWKVDFLSDNPKVLPPSTSQQKQAKTALRFPLTPLKGHASPGSKPAPSAMGAHLKPQLQMDSKLFSPGAGATLHLQPCASHQARPPPRLNWMPRSRTERPRPVVRHSSFGTTYGTGQKTGGQEGWRPFQSSTSTLLGRSNSMTDRHSANLHPNKTKT